MIIEIIKDNINILEDNDLISIKSITEELTNNPFGKYLIQKEDNEIIGYIYYSDIYERAEINQIEVKENKRNCGNGDKLLKKMIDIVQKDITLEVKENNVSAIKLYKNNGFTSKAIRKGYYQGIDGILMERKKDSN